MRKKATISGIFSASARKRWRRAAPSIWTLNAGHDQGPARSILRTLLDQPRWLEPCHLYDKPGCRLFERICELPEYYLTRTENSILREKSGAVIAQAPVQCIVELGAGSAKKTMHLLRAQLRQRKQGIFAPIDVSLTGLRASRDAVKKQLPGFKFQGLHGRYEEGVAGVDRTLPTLFIFLGSSVGNFNRSEFVRFFSFLAGSMGPKDYFLLGVDRIKETEILERAYNDSQGVTAAFILNVFQNINRLMRSNFNAGRMRYHSRYNPEWQQVEMYAVSTGTQEILFPGHSASFVWKENERILVEISRKFEPSRLQEQLRLFGLEPLAHFTDSREWFSLLLFQKSNTSTTEKGRVRRYVENK